MTDVVKNAIHALVQKYEQGKETFRSSRFNETQVRNEFLDPLFEILAQFQRLFSDINLHVMSLRFGDFRVGTTDFVFVTWIHSRCEEATTRFEAQDG